MQSAGCRAGSLGCKQRAFLTRSATTFHRMLGSGGSIKKLRKHQRVGENIEKNSLKVFKIYFQTNKIKNIKKTKKFHKRRTTQTQNIHKCSLAKRLLFRRKKQRVSEGPKSSGRWWKWWRKLTLRASPSARRWILRYYL